MAKVHRVVIGAKPQKSCSRSAHISLLSLFIPWHEKKKEKLLQGNREKGDVEVILCFIIFRIGTYCYRRNKERRIQARRKNSPRESAFMLAVGVVLRLEEKKFQWSLSILRRMKIKTVSDKSLGEKKSFALWIASTEREKRRIRKKKEFRFDDSAGEGHVRAELCRKQPLNIRNILPCRAVDRATTSRNTNHQEKVAMIRRTRVRF